MLTFNIKQTLIDKTVGNTVSRVAILTRMSASLAHKPGH